MEHRKVDFSFVGKSIEVSTDLDQDGVKSMKSKLNISEAYQEALKRGESVKVEGVKAFTMKMEGLNLKIVVDTDKDGEAVFTHEMNLPEVLDEGSKIAE